MIQHIRVKNREYFTKGIFKEKMYMSKPIDLNSILNEFILESDYDYKKFYYPYR